MRRPFWAGEMSIRRSRDRSRPGSSPTQRISGPASQIGVQQIAYSLPAWDSVTAMDRELAGAASSPASISGMKWPQGPKDVENVVFRDPGSVAGKDAGRAEVRLTIERGEILGVRGASGAGKTALATCSAGCGCKLHDRYAPSDCR